MDLRLEVGHHSSQVPGNHILRPLYWVQEPHQLPHQGHVQVIYLLDEDLLVWEFS